MRNVTVLIRVCHRLQREPVEMRRVWSTLCGCDMSSRRLISRESANVLRLSRFDPSNSGPGSNNRLVIAPQFSFSVVNRGGETFRWLAIGDGLHQTPKFFLDSAFLDTRLPQFGTHLLETLLHLLSESHDRVVDDFLPQEGDFTSVPLRNQRVVLLPPKADDSAPSELIFAKISQCLLRRQFPSNNSDRCLRQVVPRFSARRNGRLRCRSIGIGRTSDRNDFQISMLLVLLASKCRHLHSTGKVTIDLSLIVAKCNLHRMRAVLILIDQHQRPLAIGAQHRIRRD